MDKKGQIGGAEKEGVLGWTEGKELDGKEGEGRDRILPLNEIVTDSLCCRSSVRDNGVRAARQPTRLSAPTRPQRPQRPVYPGTS